MLFRSRIRIIEAGFALSCLLLFSCTERYPFFIQQPEFVESDAPEGYPGIYLSIQCEDEYALIRYTSDGSQQMNSTASFTRNLTIWQPRLSLSEP